MAMLGPPIRPVNYLESLHVPTEVTELASRQIVKVSSGFAHALFLGDDGAVWALGSNHQGQCGVGPHSIVLRKPARVSSLRDTPAMDVECGHFHSLFLSTPEQRLYSCGWNYYGQCGHNICLRDREKVISTPKVLSHFSELGERIYAMSCGSLHSAVACESGKVYSFGDGRYAQNGSTAASHIPHIVLRNVAYCKLSSGDFHSLCLSYPRRQILAWGRNGLVGRLGLGASKEVPLCAVPRQILAPLSPDTSSLSISLQFVEVSAGDVHSAGLTADGECFIWGGNTSGCLGTGSEDFDELRPTLLRHPLSSKCLTTALAGHRRRRFVQVACGGSHTLLLDEDGVVWACGSGMYGRLGVGTEHDHFSLVPVKCLPGRCIAISAGSFHSIALVQMPEADGEPPQTRVFLWGRLLVMAPPGYYCDRCG